MSLSERRLLPFLLILCAFFCGSAVSATAIALSPTTEKAVALFQELDGKVYSGRSISESLLRCSYFQDAWLAYLREAESREEFLKGMREIDRNIDDFRSALNYAANVINFFNPGNPRTLFPQEVTTGADPLFLNTFKTGKNLSAAERAFHFQVEMQQYLDEGLWEPFVLDAASIEKLESGKVYNFALFPSGMIRVAAEKPGGRDYLVNQEVTAGDFAYPNHTILAGEAEAALLSAGSLMVFRVEDKSLMFISNKSGHFVPSYNSLEKAREALCSCGMEPYTIIPLPTLDLGEAVVNLYYSVQLPLLITAEKAGDLFYAAHAKWLNALDQIDLQLVAELAEGNFSNLSKQAVANLNQAREEGTRMRSAYRLFTRQHKELPAFHKFIKHFGRLKDAIKHDVPEAICKEAAWVKTFLQDNGGLLKSEAFEVSQERELHAYLIGIVNNLRLLIAQEELTIKEFHQIKKSARELGFLFQCLADDAVKQGGRYFLYQAACDKLYRINQQMAVIHDEQIGKLLHHEAEEDEIRLSLPPSIHERLERLLNQIGITPLPFTIEIEEKMVSRLINEAKNVYAYHYYISRHPDDRRDYNYSPLPQRLLAKLSRSEVGLDEEDQQAAELFKKVLRKAEMAKNALIFLDARHASPASLDVYIDCLRNLLIGIESKHFENISEEISALTQFLDFSLNIEFGLEGYQCTDQKSFDQKLREHIHVLQQLEAGALIGIAQAQEIGQKIQALADLLELYLFIGQRYHTLPTVVYEETFKSCKMLKEELLNAVKTTSNAFVSVSEHMAAQAATLCQRFELERVIN